MDKLAATTIRTSGAWQADQLGRRQDFRRLVVRIAGELERVELLHADDLRALMDPTPETVAA